MIGSDGKGKVLVMCPYYNSGVFSREPNSKYSYHINCCTEIKKFNMRADVAKVYRTYCCTDQFSKCPFYKSHIDLIQNYGADKLSEYKIRDGMHYESWYVNDLYEDFPNIDEDYSAVWEQDLPTRLLHLSDAYLNVETHHEWTEADDKLLLKQYSVIWNYDDIAKVIKRTKSSVNQRLDYLKQNHPDEFKHYKDIRTNKFNHCKKPWMPEERALMFLKWNTGSSYKELSEICGRTEKACRHLIALYKKGAYGDDNWSGNERMALYAVYYSGGTLKEMSEKSFHDEGECKLMVERIENGEFPDLHHQCYPTARDYNPEDDKRILELKAQGNGFISIAKIMGGDWTKGKVTHRYKTLIGGKPDYGKSRPISREH